MKIFCIGRNYIDHAKELNNPVPKAPLVFMKPVTAILKQGKPFYLPEFSNEIHYEAELVLRICKNGKHVHHDYTKSYIGEIGLGIDFTARDVQARLKEKGHPWEIAKAFDHSAVIGDFQSVDNFPDLGNISFELKKNGEIVQKGNSADLIFPFERLISHISEYFTVNVADLLFTGTPAGVGPIKIGDHLEGYLESKKVLDCLVK